MNASDAAVLRQVYPRVLARTLAFASHLPDAEDAVQEAMVRALVKWPLQGRPDHPDRWLVRVATNVHRDRVKKGKWEVAEGDIIEQLAEMSPWARSALAHPDIGRGWKDDLLRLLFACCHPALQHGESAALCLATIVGLSPAEIASAFRIEKRTLEQRLTRARRRLRERGDGEGAPPQASQSRLAPVLTVIRLIYNEGYWSSGGDFPLRGDLRRLALGLAHSCREHFAEDSEANGLLALLLLHEARVDARLDTDGIPVSLPEQDRTLWNHRAIANAIRLLEPGAKSVGPLRVEAAIAATHCRALTAEDTNWGQIAELYEALESLTPTPGVRVNRAFAVAKASGAESGLALLERDWDALQSEPYRFLVRGALHQELGRIESARRDLEQALALARNTWERRSIATRLDELSQSVV